VINLVPTIVLTRLGQLVNPYLIAAESQSFTPGRNLFLSINPLDSDGINMTLDFFLREAGERRQAKPYKSIRESPVFFHE